MTFGNDWPSDPLLIPECNVLAEIYFSFLAMMCGVSLCMWSFSPQLWCVFIVVSSPC